jgi:hypothetical protein
MPSTSATPNCQRTSSSPGADFRQPPWTTHLAKRPGTSSPTQARPRTLGTQIQIHRPTPSEALTIGCNRRRAHSFYQSFVTTHGQEDKYRTSNAGLTCHSQKPINQRPQPEPARVGLERPATAGKPENRGSPWGGLVSVSIEMGILRESPSSVNGFSKQFNNFFYPLVSNHSFSGADRTRTDDPRLAKPMLSQLSYGPNGYLARLESTEFPRGPDRLKKLSGSGRTKIRTSDLVVISDAL